MAVNKTKLKKQIFDIIQIGDKSNLASRAFDIFIVGVILSNISVMFLQTYDQLEPYYGLLSVIEWVTTGIFCVEYILRIWTADFLYPTCTRGKAIGKFLISYDGVVDLLTIIPVFFLSGFVAFRMLRVIRIFHLFRSTATDLTGGDAIRLFVGYPWGSTCTIFGCCKCKL